MIVKQILLAPSRYHDPLDFTIAATTTSSDMVNALDSDPQTKAEINELDAVKDIVYNGVGVGGLYWFIDVAHFENDLEVQFYGTGPGVSPSINNVYADGVINRIEAVSGPERIRMLSAINDRGILVEVGSGIVDSSLRNWFKLEWELPGAGAAYDTDIWEFMFCEGLVVPPYNQGPTTQRSFPAISSPVKGATGTHMINFKQSFSAEEVQRVSFTWAELTEIQKDDFETFFRQMGSAWQPIVIATITDNIDGTTGTTEASFEYILIDSSPIVSRKNDNYFDITITGARMSRGVS